MNAPAPPESPTPPAPLVNITAQVLVVDDEVDHAEVMAEALRRLGHVCTVVHDLPSAREELTHGSFDLIVTDLVMEGERDGLEVLATARQSQRNAEAILVTAHGDVPTAKAALKGGAYDFIEKPLDLDVFRTLCNHAIQAVMLREQNTQLREQLDEKYGFEGIIGQSGPIRQLVGKLKQIAPSNIPVLITGESGTGKELVAAALHNNSRRAKRQFVPLNCAGLSESILEDELFGHVKGAFTGADREREGRFEYADGGTLFLDEIGDMPLLMQAKLLRVLESGEVVRLGSNQTRHVDVRLVAATNRDIEAQVKDGRFRSDLYFRIMGVGLHLPALRDRPEDIPLLVRHYLQKFAKEMEMPLPQVSEDAMLTLMRFDWPGNVRQLINVVQNMLIMGQDEQLEPRHLPEEVRQQSGGGGGEANVEVPAGMSLDQIEKQAIRNTLRANKGNREVTAKMLGIGERTLYRKLDKYGIK